MGTWRFLHLYLMVVRRDLWKLQYFFLLLFEHVSRFLIKDIKEEGDEKVGTYASEYIHKMKLHQGIPTPT